ncbi:MAG: hypothetical protein HKL82_08760 [Acidimicrobiaceae bacterium]|nr:hypothetical protein [Acidimicrobiaceae bacterium]
MAQRTQGGMWCASCKKPIMGVGNTHRFRNAFSVMAVPATGGLSLGGLKSTSFVCPTCGGPAVTKAVAARQAMKANVQEQHEADRRRKVDDGAWWLLRGVFRGILPIKTLYLGGRLPTVDPDVGRNGTTLRLNVQGLQLLGTFLKLKGTFKVLFTIPWSDVTDIAIESPTVSRHSQLISEVRTQGHDDHENEAVLIVEKLDGSEVLFLISDITPEDLAATLARVIEGLNETKGP